MRLKAMEDIEGLPKRSWWLVVWKGGENWCFCSYSDSIDVEPRVAVAQCKVKGRKMYCLRLEVDRIRRRPKKALKANGYGGVDSQNTAGGEGRCRNCVQ